MENGEIVSLTIQSDLLVQNRAGDSSNRPVLAYVPKGHRGNAEKRFPALYLLAPWTNAGRSQFEWKPFRESLGDRLDRLIFEKRMPPCVVIAVDTYSRFGGSQFIDSAFFGPHGMHIVEELIPFCEKNLPVQPGPAFRGVFGRSSGGFGALRLAMDFPGIFSSVACHSGDLGFELLYGGELAVFPEKLAKFQGSVRSFLDYVWSAPKLAGGDIHLLMLLGMCGFYSPNLQKPVGFDLPIDLQSGEIVRDVWSRWLEHDPLLKIDSQPSGLKKLKALYLDCGSRDQYHLLWGARQLHAKLTSQKLVHSYFEFNDDHSGTEYRFDESLPILASALI